MRGLYPIKITSAKEQVASELRKAILSRHIKEGEVLSLERVAHQLNISITPVREAFQILARDGLIHLRQNRGAIVLGVNEAYIREHYELRAILETACVGIVCNPNIDISNIIKSYEEAKSAIEVGDFSDYANLNREFHNEIWNATGNIKMKNIISELWNGLSIGIMVTESEYVSISFEEHKRIIEAIIKRDKDTAEKEMYQHIIRSRDDMLTYYI